MRHNSSPTDASSNFERRLKETMDTETDPEMYTPFSSGNEEFPEGEEVLPIVRQFRQTNMRGGGGRGRSTSGRGKDQD
jgi:hypothetical protein